MQVIKSLVIKSIRKKLADASVFHQCLPMLVFFANVDVFTNIELRGLLPMKTPATAKGQR